MTEYFKSPPNKKKRETERTLNNQESWFLRKLIKYEILPRWHISHKKPRFALLSISCYYVS
jgi:hypothetical protein